jgi:hypothetical protein
MTTITTEQEAFDAVALWLLRPDATQCMGPEGNCVYGIYELTHNNRYAAGQELKFINACGIGGIIDDPLRQRIVFGDYVQYSGQGVRNLIESIPELEGWMDLKHFLGELQQVHDNIGHWGDNGFNHLGVLALAEIAKNKQLTLNNIQYALDPDNQ